MLLHAAQLRQQEKAEKRRVAEAENWKKKLAAARAEVRQKEEVEKKGVVSGEVTGDDGAPAVNGCGGGGAAQVLGVGRGRTLFWALVVCVHVALFAAACLSSSRVHVPFGPQHTMGGSNERIFSFETVSPPNIGICDSQGTSSSGVLIDAPIPKAKCNAGGSSVFAPSSPDPDVDSAALTHGSGVDPAAPVPCQQQEAPPFTGPNQGKPQCWDSAALPIVNPLKTLQPPHAPALAPPLPGSIIPKDTAIGESLPVPIAVSMFIAKSSNASDNDEREEQQDVCRVGGNCEAAIIRDTSEDVVPIPSQLSSHDQSTLLAETSATAVAEFLEAFMNAHPRHGIFFVVDRTHFVVESRAQLVSEPSLSLSEPAL